MRHLRVSVWRSASKAPVPDWWRESEDAGAGGWWKDGAARQTARKDTLYKEVKGRCMFSTLQEQKHSADGSPQRSSRLLSSGGFEHLATKQWRNLLCVSQKLIKSLERPIRINTGLVWCHWQKTRGVLSSVSKPTGRNIVTWIQIWVIRNQISLVCHVLIRVIRIQKYVMFVCLF